jgi:WD40 repeat protein
MAVAETGFYVTGGTMPYNAPSYVERQADHDLYDALTQGEFCYVLTARQMGKSSLMVRTAARLRQEGVRVAILDLTVIGQNLTPEQWYSGLLATLGEQFDQEPELWEYWQEHSRLSPLQRWIAAIRDILLQPAADVEQPVVVGSASAYPTSPRRTPNTQHRTPIDPCPPGPLVIFIDEIDAVLNLPFSTDEFFAAIRACYNRRSKEPEFQQLTFCLMGVATPSDLIQDTRTTPFNIGRRIELADLTHADAAPLAQGLAQSCRAAHCPAEREDTANRRLLGRILYWTGGHPYLTQRLCQAVAGDPSAPPSANVDRQCEALFLSAAARERDDNLLFVRERLLRSEPDVAGLLDLYQRVRSGRRVPLEDTNHLAGTLVLSGIARVEQVRRPTGPPFVRPVAPLPYLRVRNRIYERVFDRAWVTQHMPDAELRRQRRAYRAGLARAASAAGTVLLVVAVLAVAALEQAHRADLNARDAQIKTQEARHSSRVARVNLLRAKAEAKRANSEAVRASGQAKLARRAEALERKQRTGAEAARQDALRQKLIAEREEGAATQARRRAELAELNAKDKLWASYVAQARAERWSGRQGRRFNGLRALASAAAIRASRDLRNEAIACLSLVDLRQTWQGRFDDTVSHDFSPDLKRLALGDRRGNLWVRRVADGRLLNHFSGHIGLVSPVRFSADGRFLAGGFRRGWTADLSIWDLEHNRPVLRLPEGLYADAVDFSPDSRLVAAGRADGSIRLYELRSGAETVGIPPGPRPPSLQFDPRPAYLQFDPHGRRLAVTSLDSRSVQILDAATGAVVTTLGSPTQIRDVAWHPHRNLLAGAGDNWHVYVWNVDSPERPLARLEGHHGEVTRVGFTQGGELLVSGGWDQTVRLWNLATQSQVLNLPGASFSLGRDERHLGVLLGSSKVQIWQLDAGRECRTFRHYGAGKGPWSGGISRDGRLLVSAGDRDVAVWDLTTGRQIASLPESGSRSAFFHPTAPYLITSGADGIHRWPIQTTRSGAVEIGPPHPITRPALFERSAISRDGLTLAIAEGHSPATLRVLHFGPDAWQRQLKAQPSYSLFPDVSPDGRWIAAGAWQGTGVNVWEARTGRLVKALPNNDFTNVRFSPNGQWLATATGAVTQILRVGSWQPGLVVSREDPETAQGSVAFSPDGSVVALEKTRRVVKLIEVSTGLELAQLEASDVPLCRPICFSRDGNLLLTAGGPELLQVWDLRAIRKGLHAVKLDWPS